MKERWVIYGKKADFNAISQKYGIDPVLARIIRNRDIIEEEIERYLNGTVQELHSPRLMKDMESAVDLLREGIRAGKKIAVASDYDVDGIFSAITLLEGIAAVGGDAFADMPHRIKEGYGLNKRIVEEAFDKGAGIILTCDNGIAAFDAVERAKELGMNVIVTDHHEVAFREEDGVRHYILPCADAIVDPKRMDCEYPFSGLCGAGVAYKLIELLYEKEGISKQQLYPLLEYAAIATVADVMDLAGENRIIVKEGLRRLGHTKNAGLQAIMEVNQIRPESLNSYHIGFVIGPCFNAAGRLDTARRALALLQCRDQKEALKIAAELKQLNDARKDMTEKGVKAAIEIIEQALWKENPVLLLYLKGCHESLAGIIAGRIREKYHRPVFVFTDAEHGIKGSGRSIEAYHMFDGLVKCRELLDRFGGHAMAAGLSLQKKNLELLREKLNKECGLTSRDLIPIVPIDAAMPLGYIREEFIEQLKKLEPFGKGNNRPLFARQHFRILKAVILGKNQNTCKMQVVDAEDGTVLDALYFGDIIELFRFIEEEYGKDQLERVMSGRQNEIDLAFTYYPSINEFRGVRTIQIVIQNYCRI